jgi:hypothetical protein
VGELAAVATASIVVLLNCPEIASVKAEDERTCVVSETIPLTVIETVTLAPIWDRTKPPTQSCVADGAHDAGTKRFAWKSKFGRAERVSQLSIDTGVPTGKNVNGALTASDMSSMVPDDDGFTAVNVPDPPVAVRVPIPVVDVPHEADPPGLLVSIGHQSM